MDDFEKIFSEALEEITSLGNSIDKKEIHKMVELICSKKFDHIVGFGAGRMGYSLRGFIMRLCHIGVDAYMIGDTNFPRINQKTLVIVNSSSGETETSLLYAKQAKKEGAYIVTVTQEKFSSLGIISDHIIEFSLLKSKQIMKTLPEQFTFILFDTVSELIIRKFGSCREYISKNHSISE